MTVRKDLKEKKFVLISNHTCMKRRKFLYGLSSVAVISVAGAYLYSNRKIAYDPVIAEPFFLSHIWDEESIEDAGRKYLSVADDEKDEQELVKRIARENGATGPDSIQMINAQIADDFKNDRIVLVDGWLLSVTEARQCGLYSMLQES